MRRGSKIAPCNILCCYEFSQSHKANYVMVGTGGMLVLFIISGLLLIAGIDRMLVAKLTVFN